MRNADFTGCGLRELTIRGDERGSLIAIEGGRDVPFEIRRAYYIFGTRPEIERGHHAHYDLRQFATCVSGSCRITLDNGAERQEYELNHPSRALAIGPMIWREMSLFSPDCVLLVLADRLYDEADYIRDYDHFLQLTS